MSRFQKLVNLSRSDNAHEATLARSFAASLREQETWRKLQELIAPGDALAIDNEDGMILPWMIEELKVQGFKTKIREEWVFVRETAAEMVRPIMGKWYL